MAVACQNGKRKTVPLAKGLKLAFTRFGKFCRKIIDPEPKPAVIYQTLPSLEIFFNPDPC